MSMNIPPHIPQVVVNSAAPATESLAKANALREVVPPAVKPAAIVPQKSREQDVRPPINQPSVSTYENIQSNRYDSQVIPESDEQSQGEQASDQEQDSPEKGSEQANQGATGASDDESNSSQSTSINNAGSDDNASDEEAQKQQQQEQQQIQQLQQRDNEVKAHEQAHAAIGGTYAGTPSYEYQTGPNGQKYAVGGEVSIDVSKEATPEATIRKMQTVQAAALAPAEPSSQDRKVAAQAARNIADARAEMVQQNASVSTEKEGSTSPSSVQLGSLPASETGAVEGDFDQSGLDFVSSTSVDDNGEYPNKMALAKDAEQIQQSQVFESKTAQVISNRYATATIPHEQGFSAVA
ncbi:MAG: hypothetical protein ACJAZB_001930 [Psychrosphaera sp.]|jgi:hypothetical protein